MCRGSGEIEVDMQFLADILDIDVDRPVVRETTALGAAYLAGLQSSVFPSIEAIGTQWRREATFMPKLTGAERDGLCAAWRAAVARGRPVT